jgi:hypothetical protein
MENLKPKTGGMPLDTVVNDRVRGETPVFETQCYTQVFHMVYNLLQTSWVQDLVFKTPQFVTSIVSNNM